MFPLSIANELAQTHAHPLFSLHAHKSEAWMETEELKISHMAIAGGLATPP